jgi:hypothetical protein
MQLRTFLHAAVKNAGLIAALFSTILNPIAPLPLNAESKRGRDNNL